MSLPHTLGQASLAQYNTLHSDLQTIVDWGLQLCAVDFSIHEGHRIPAKQFEYFKKGRELINGEWVLTKQKNKITNIDGIKVKGKHNYNPSLAFDFTAYVPDKPELKWDTVHLTYIGASLIMIAEFLYNRGDISHKLRWGGNWDKDGDLADNTLYDRPHVELYTP
jgi:peptidoglycan L-alanyl-D-glutamate endopeptidase CwlK